MAFTFEWDPGKAASNARKHGVTFDEAATAFVDPLGRIVEDPRHSSGEPRFALLGYSDDQRLLAVMFTERGGRTTVTVRWAALNATDAEREAFAGGLAGMQQGWKGTFEQLEEYLARA